MHMGGYMHKSVRLLILLAACTGLLALTFHTPLVTKEPAKSPDAHLVERGAYLLMIGGCNDCHTPKIFGPEGMSFDLEREYMGHPATEKLPDVPEGVVAMDGWGFISNHNLSAFVGPWGISFAANLTPDKETGIGSWTEEMFIKTLRTGKHMGEGRDILPPMPWFNLAEAKEEDLKAIFAYLKSVKPINNPVPQPIPPQH
jgi:mono/diheme cytochrome c family protein